MPLKKISQSSSSSLRFPFAAIPKSGAHHQVANGIHWCRHDLPFALDHINTWLLQDHDKWVIVDTGVSDDRSQDGWRNILDGELSGSEISKIIVTHYHPDHIGNADWLSKRSLASVWMSSSEFLTAHAVFDKAATHSAQATGALFRQHGLPDDEVDSVSAKGDHYKPLVRSLPTSFLRITNGETLDVGESSWQIIVGSGHSPEHLSLFCETEQVLISGDMLLPKISTNVAVWPYSSESNPLKEFLTSIDLFQDLPVDTLVLPSHGLPFIGMHSRIHELKMHHEERLNKLLSVCDEPKNAFQVLPLLFERTLDTYQTFFAMGEAIAHLNFLWWEGELTRQQSETEGGVVHFIKN